MITDESLERIEHAIKISQNASAFAKKCVLWLLRKKIQLGGNLCLSIAGDAGTDMADGAHDMVSDIRKTKINEVLEGCGCNFFLNGCYGTFVDGRFVPRDENGGGVIWLSDEPHDHAAQKFSPEIAEIEGISLE
jgi:hypothetical protein